MRPAKLVVVVVLVLAGVGLITAVIVGLNKKTIVPNAEPVVESGAPVYKVVGMSVQGRKIESYTYGKGSTHLLFVGGMHGGYEWNSVLLAYDVMDYFKEYLGAFGEKLSITVIPSLNPDGVYKVIGKEGRFVAGDATTSKTVLASGRFNAHGVDLNRNFDCKWKPTSTWQTKTVSAGSAPFSEPEAEALRSVVAEIKPSAAIFWHSQANAVYASACNNGILPQTIDIMNVYAQAAKYPAVKTFDAYAVTGDAEGWLASIGVPAITVELQTHEYTEWEKNLAGVKALLLYYSK